MQFVHWPEVHPGLGLAQIEPGAVYHRVSMRLFEADQHPELLSDWEEVTMRLDEGVPVAYQPSSPAMRLCSATMRDVIDTHRAPEDVIQWLPVRLIDTAEVEHEYFALHFPKRPSPVIAGDRGRVVPVPGGGSTMFVVSDDLMIRLIDGAGCLAANFSRARERHV